MFRTAAAIAVATVVGLVVLRVVLGVMGGALGILFSLAWFALKLLIFAFIAYLVIAMISPETAKKIRRAVGLDDAPTV